MEKPPLIFGCDVCQDTCPNNSVVKATPLPEFYQDRLPRLSPSDIESLSNKQFQQAFGDRAFAWRGKKVLLRNLEYAAKQDAASTKNRNDGKDDV